MKPNENVTKILNSAAFGIAMAIIAGLSAFANSMGERERTKQHEEMWKAFQKSNQQ